MQGAGHAGTWIDRIRTGHPRRPGGQSDPVRSSRLPGELTMAPSRHRSEVHNRGGKPAATLDRPLATPVLVNKSFSRLKRPSDSRDAARQFSEGR
jgi:hypothetical protein